MKVKTKEAIMYRLSIADKTAASLVRDLEVIRDMIQTEDVPELDLEFEGEEDNDQD